MVIIIYTFVLDDSLINKRFIPRTEQLNKCCEPLQKIKVRYAVQAPSDFILTDRSKAILPLWFLVVLCFGVEFLCCLSVMYVFVFFFFFCFCFFFFFFFF